MNKLFSLFRKEKLEVKIGEIYSLYKDNPFHPIKVKVLDIKDGWVLYANCISGYESSLKVDIFLRVYEK